MIYADGIEKIIYDLASYLIIIFVLFLVFFTKNKFFYLKAKNKKNIFLTIILFSSTPFFFNSVLFNPIRMWDQVQYLNILNNNVEFSYDHLKIFIPAYVYKFFFIFPTYSINSIAFINKFILLFSLIFLLVKNKLNLESFIYILLVPSIIFYSSVSLKEILITTFSIWAIYFIFEKNFYAFFSIIFTLFLIRPEYAVIFGFFLILTESNIFSKNYNKYIFLILCIFFLILISKYFLFILGKISEIKMIYYQETHTWQSKIYATDKYNLLNIFDLMQSLSEELFKKFFVLKNIPFIFQIFFILENFLLIFFIYKSFFNKTTTKNIKIIYTTYILFMFILIYFLVDNHFTANRYFFSFFSSYLVLIQYKRKVAK